jgi:hypothetical protein
MRIAAVVAFAACITVNGFAPAFTRSRTTRLFSEPEQKEVEGLDLDLGEMFEMYATHVLWGESVASLEWCFLQVKMRR